MIRPQIKLFGQTVFIYGLSNVLNKFVSIILVPLYVSFLNINEVGYVAIFEMFELFFITLIPLGSVNAMFRYLPGKIDVEKNKILFCVLTITFVSSIIILSFLLLFSKNISSFLGLGHHHFILKFVAFSCALRAISNFTYWFLQYNNQAFRHLILSIIEFISVIILIIYFITFLKTGIVGIYYAKIIVYSLFIAFTFPILFIKKLTLPSLEIIKKLLNYGLPFIPLSLLMPVLNMSDRYFLGLFTSIDDVGKYGIAYKFGMLINIFLILPVQKTWMPQMFQINDKKMKSRAIHKDITFYYSLIGIFFLLVVSLFSHELLYFFTNDNYVNVHWIIPIISFGHFLGGFRLFFMAGASIRDRTDLFIKISVITIICNLFLNYFLIKQLSILGAVLSLNISYFILIMLLLKTSNTVSKIVFPLNKIIFALAIAFSLFLLHLVFLELLPKLNLFLKFATMVWFLIICKVSGLVGHRELDGIKSLLSLRKKKV